MRGRLNLIAAIGAELQITGVLPAIIYGVAYTATLGQFGGVGILTFSTPVGALPAGITFGDNGNGTCTFTGTSTAPGTYPITLNGLDADRNPVSRSFVLSVQVLPITLTGAAPDTRTDDAPDTFSYGVSGGSGVFTNYAVGSGALPPGWTIAPATGVITRASTTVGHYSWTIVVTDSFANTSAGYPDSADVRYPVITLTGSFASIGWVGGAYSSDITITGGDGVYSNPRFTSGSIAGLSLSVVTVLGVKKLRMSGAPTTAGTPSITAAVDAHEFDGTVVTAAHSQSITIDPALTLTGSFTSPAAPGVSYQSDLLLGGGDGTYTLHGGTGIASGTLPTGLALSIVTVSGSKYLRLSGTPTGYSGGFTVSIDSGDGQNLTSAQTVIVSVSLAAGTFAAPLYDGVSYSQTIPITGGSGTYSSPAVASGSLPTGLSLSVSGANLVLSGTCSAGATFTFTCTVNDSLGNTSAASASQSLTRQDQQFASVIGLYPFDGINGSTNAPDVALGHDLTCIIGAALVTATKKWGSASVYMPAGRCWSPTHNDYVLGTGDFTIEFWLNPVNGGAGDAFGRIFQLGADSQTGGLYVYRNGTPNPLSINVQVWTGSAFANVFSPTATNTIPNSQWTHVALTRASGVWRMYYDGVKQVERSFTSAGNNLTPVTTPNNFRYFNIGANQASVERFNGYMDDLRITKGVARYGTANFTPPADAFPTS